MPIHPSTAPAELDGALVQRYASLEGMAQFAKVSATVDGVPSPTPAAVAIATYPGESDAYVFHCSPQWTVIAAGHYVSPELAVRAAEHGFPGVAARWVVVPQPDR